MGCLLCQWQADLGAELFQASLGPGLGLITLLGKERGRIFLEGLGAPLSSSQEQSPRGCLLLALFMPAELILTFAAHGDSLAKCDQNPPWSLGQLGRPKTIVRITGGLRLSW